MSWFLICKAFWEQPWIFTWLLWHSWSAWSSHLAFLRVVSLELSKFYSDLWLRESLSEFAMGGLREHRNFFLPILNLEYAFLIFISYLWKLFEEYNMNMWKEDEDFQLKICFCSFHSSEMKQKLDEEGNKCSILSKQQKFNEHCCIRCCSPFTFLINSKRQCQDCKYNICKSCSTYQKKEKAWICSVCLQAR